MSENFRDVIEFIEDGAKALLVFVGLISLVILVMPPLYNIMVLYFGLWGIRVE